MKKFAMFLMLLGASMLTLGCEPAKPKPTTDTGKPAAGEPAPEKPAEPAPPK